MSDPIKVLFVCVHNAARSRIAEAYLKELGGPEFEVTSSGFEPQEANPLVVEAMKLASVPLPATGNSLRYSTFSDLGGSSTLQGSTVAGRSIVGVVAPEFLT